MKTLTPLAGSPVRGKHAVQPSNSPISFDRNYWEEEPRLTFADKRKKEMAASTGQRNFDSLSERYSEIEESEDVAMDPIISLPPLSISHFARIE